MKAGIQNGSDGRRYVAVKRRDGSVVPGVYVRDGKYYARFVDPSTGRRRWAASRDGTQAGAEAIVRAAKREQRGARAERFAAAIEASALRVEGATIADCLALYPEAAAARRRMMGGEPREGTGRARLSRARGGPGRAEGGAAPERPPGPGASRRRGGSTRGIWTRARRMPGGSTRSIWPATRAGV